LLLSIAIFQLHKYCNTTRNTKYGTSIAIPVAILKGIAILIAIIAIKQSKHSFTAWMNECVF